MGRLLAVLGLYFVAAASTSGQEYMKREVFGSVGVGKTYDDEGSLGKGINGAGGAGYRLTRRFGVEVEVSGFQTKREIAFTPAPFQARGALVMANGLLYLNRGRGQFYLIGGAGMLHIRNQVGFGGVPVNRSDNGLAVDFGIGVKIFATSHIVLRPEARIFGGDSGRAVEAPFTDMRFSIGAGYCW